jgi:hypothetical protein
VLKMGINDIDSWRRKIGCFHPKVGGLKKKTNFEFPCANNNRLTI